MQAREDEVHLGLVLFLDPILLERGGAEWTCPDRWRVGTPHFFVCVDAGPDPTSWRPLFSRWKPWRRQLPGARRGHPAWTQGVYHYDLNQLWRASRATVCAASWLDRSPCYERNRLTRSNFAELARCPETA